MATFLKAPDDVSSCSVEGVEYPVEDGLAKVDNPEHCLVLIERHGFEHSHNEGEDAPVEEKVENADPDDPGECPDFEKFANRGDLANWLIAHGVPDADANENRPALEQSCKDRHAVLVEEFAAKAS